MPSLKERLSWRPETFEIAAKALRFFRKADDSEELQEALAAGDLERAQQLTDMSEDEFHEYVTGWREQAEDVADDLGDEVDDEDFKELLT